MESGQMPPETKYQVQKPIMKINEHQATTAVVRLAVLRT
jgi:hypothetical protein